MKKLILSFTLLFAVLFAIPVMAQTTTKEAKKSIKKRSIKEARKAARKMKKQDYFVAPGALPLDKQLENAYIKQSLVDEDGYPAYIVASGNSVAGTQTAARVQAIETAKMTLAGTISTNVAALIENNIANEQFTKEEAATVTKIVAASKNIITQQLGRYIPLTELYKEVGKENIQADVMIAYDSKTAMDMAKQVVRKQLSEQADELQDKLDDLMNF